MSYSDQKNTGIGRKWEKWALKNLFPSGVLQTYNNRAFDILDGNARIDVKASKLYVPKARGGKYFDFKVKFNTGCDYFLFIGYRYKNSKDPEKVWLIPACLVNNQYRVYVSPNHTGQWKEFEINWRKAA